MKNWSDQFPTNAKLIKFQQIILKVKSYLVLDNYVKIILF